MKAIEYIKNKSVSIATFACLGGFLFSACRDEIDTSAMYTMTADKIGDFLTKNQDMFGKYVQLLEVVPQSKMTESSVMTMLSSYKHATCFAPTNQALDNYMAQLYEEGKYGTKDFSVFIDSIKAGKHYSDSLAKELVYNSIIECGYEEAFETSTFPVENGTFQLPNMYDRYLTAYNDVETGDKVQYYLLKDARVAYPNNKADNGVVHGMEKVVIPSSESVGALFQNIENMQLFGLLMTKTGWIDSVSTKNYLDKAYEELYQNEDLSQEIFNNSHLNGAFVPEHRKTGFTIFAETDDVLTEELGLTNPDELLTKLSEYLKGKYAGLPYADKIKYGTSDAELRQPDNAINQFVSYHILPMSLPNNQLVYHYNEKDFDLKSAINGNIKITIPVFEFYETMTMKGGPRRLLKIYESQQSGGPRLNRKPVMNPKDYQEFGVEEEGILIGGKENGLADVVSALNGYLYPIQGMLVYTSSTVNTVLKDRLRFDGVSIVPELMSLGYRRPMKKYQTPEGNSSDKVYFPTDFKLKNITRSPYTKFAYLTAVGSADFWWSDYQGDELMALGNYDITVKLPPVPKDGTYEIRWAVQGNELRGMCQVYFGAENETLVPMDIPMDLRMVQFGDNGGLVPFNVGWEKESEDQSYNEQVNRNLRNQNWMKGPRYFKDNPLTAANRLVYNNPACVRRILAKKYMYHDKTYYIRFKSALEDKNTQFFFDYFEIVPSEIYNNPTGKLEDEW